MCFNRHTSHCTNVPPRGNIPFDSACRQKTHRTRGCHVHFSYSGGRTGRSFCRLCRYPTYCFKSLESHVYWRLERSHRTTEIKICRRSVVYRRTPRYGTHILSSPPSYSESSFAALSRFDRSDKECLRPIRPVAYLDALDQELATAVLDTQTRCCRNRLVHARRQRLLQRSIPGYTSPCSRDAHARFLETVANA